MALVKNKELRNGFEATYWRLHPVMSVDLNARTVSGMLRAYKDKAAKDAGKEPVDMHDPDLDDQLVVTLSGEEFETAIATGDFRSAMYTKIKATKVFFSDATDED